MEIDCILPIRVGIAFKTGISFEWVSCSNISFEWISRSNEYLVWMGTAFEWVPLCAPAPTANRNQTTVFNTKRKGEFHLRDSIWRCDYFPGCLDRSFRNLNIRNRRTPVNTIHSIERWKWKFSLADFPVTRCINRLAGFWQSLIRTHLLLTMLYKVTTSYIASCLQPLYN